MKKYILVGALFALTFLSACGKVQFESTPEYVDSLKVQESAIFINNNDPFTNKTQVQLTLPAKNADEMFVSTDPHCSDHGHWQPYQRQLPWTLHKKNQRVRLYVKYKNNKGDITPCLQDDIFHDDIPPKLIDSRVPQNMTNKSQDSIQFTVQDLESQLDQVGCELQGQPFPCQNINPNNLSHLTAGSYHLQLKATDHAKNVSTFYLTWKVEQVLERQVQDYNIKNHGQLDLLFIVDNSGSMKDEQEKISKRFSGLLSYFTDLNWNIAITTTDVSSSRQPYQDGQLTPFDSSEKTFWISSDMNQRKTEKMFSDTIQRSELGSDRESGLGAMMRFLQRFQKGDEAHRGFIRPESQLNVIVVSDENESDPELKSQPILVKNSAEQVLPGKTFHFHSIVVREQDQRCRQQSGHTVGLAYEALSFETEGVTASVCSEDYASPLSQIGESIRENFKEIRLRCTPWDDNQDGQPDLLIESSLPYPSYEIHGDKVQFADTLPVGQFRFVYNCPVF